MSSINGSIFTRALDYTKENRISKEDKAQLQALDAERSNIQRALNLAHAAIDRSQMRPHEKQLAKAQATAEAKAADFAVIEKIHKIDPSRAVTATETASKMALIAVAKGQEIGTAVGGVAGVALSPISCLISEAKRGLLLKTEKMGKFNL